MDTFKGIVGDLEYYFKPKGNSEYLVEPYRHKLKPFKIVKRAAKDVDGAAKKEWLIPHDENIPEQIRSSEPDFSNCIQERLSSES